MKLVIVEGSDYSGKTTYIQNRMKHLDGEIIKTPFADGSETLRFMSNSLQSKYIDALKHFKFGEDQFNIMFDIHKECKNFLEDISSRKEYKHKTVFMDRNFISTLVYQYDYIRVREIIKLKNLIIESIPTEVVLLQPSWDTIELRSKLDRGKEKSVTDMFEDNLKRRYDLYKVISPLVKEWYPNLSIIKE